MKYIDIIEKKKSKKRKNKKATYTGWGWIYPYGIGGDPTEIVSESKDSNPTADDIASVAEWFHTTTDNLIINIVEEPITKFLKQIRELYNSYDKYPRDANRTKKIMKEIKNNNKIYPIYVENGDPSLFVMEGRHRMVAFMLLGFTTIPVAYVSKKT